MGLNKAQQLKQCDLVSCVFIYLCSHLFILMLNAVFEYISVLWVGGVGEGKVESGTAMRKPTPIRRLLEP